MSKSSPKTSFHPVSFVRNHFIAGVLVLTPLVVIGLLFRIALEWITSAAKAVPFLSHEGPAAIFMNLLALVVLITLITLLGLASKLYLGQKVLSYVGILIHRIPVLGTIYSSLEQLFQIFGSSNGKKFSRVVYIEYPRKGLHAIAFVTGPVKGGTLPRDYVNLFVPTVPNPTSGYHLILPESEIKDAGLTVEQAFKTILSLGIADPNFKPSSGDRRG